MTFSLNYRAAEFVESLTAAAETLRIAAHDIPGGGRVYDFGIEADGGLNAGVHLARVCLAGLGDVTLVPGELDGIGWPQVFVTTDHPVAACLYSQYAGWQISVEKYFAMGSGPMRAAAAREELFQKLNYRETADRVVGVLEGRKLPTPAVLRFIADRTGISAERITLLIAPTASIAGNLQVVTRSVETALHKLFELGFDVNRVRSACGVAPLPPVACDDLTGIGRTNDAILYGGRVTLFVCCDDESLAEIGPKVPALSAACHGQPFLQIFEQAGRDFYKIDPHLFSPAEVVFHNLDTGRVHHFGRVEPQILKQSFGI